MFGKHAHSLASTRAQSLLPHERVGWWGGDTSKDLVNRPLHEGVFRGEVVVEGHRARAELFRKLPHAEVLDARFSCNAQRRSDDLRLRELGFAQSMMDAAALDGGRSRVTSSG